MLDSDMVVHPARQHLVLDLDGVETGGLGQRDGAMVRCIWTGSPHPAPPSRMTGRSQAARMSTATSASSGSFRLASVTHFSQPSDPPLR